MEDSDVDTDQVRERGRVLEGAVVHTHVTAEILPVVLPVVLAEGPVHDGEVHHGIMVWHHGRVRGDGQVDVGHVSGWQCCRI